MTKLETNWFPEAIPGFDCVKMKREIQAQIYEETRQLTPEEQRERLRQAGERAAVRRKKLSKQLSLQGEDSEDKS